VLLADDHPPICERVRSLLETSYWIVGSVDNGMDLVLEAERLQPEVVILDISMPKLTGIEAARELRKRGSNSKFIFLTVYEQIEFVNACLEVGALGYVVKSRLAQDLITALYEVLSGRLYVSPLPSR
jgi:DNA-binding NarL/FixJ family response regulator